MGRRGTPRKSPALGVNYKTTQGYLDILTGAFMVRQLQPWVENLGKRVRKAPKIYLRDSGLFHALMNLRTVPELQAHPKLGASWEGMALEQVLRVLPVAGDEAFRGPHAGAELDLLVLLGGKRFGFESVRGRPARPDPCGPPWRTWKLRAPVRRLPGDKSFHLDDTIEAIPLAHIGQLRLGD